jgi:hypothetical protein
MDKLSINAVLNIEYSWLVIIGCKRFYKYSLMVIYTYLLC